MTLSQILNLVGKLDDASNGNSARERFRSYLIKNVTKVNQFRDYIGECLRESGDQYNKALQDLVNQLGYYLGFEVTFGRYKGASGEVGNDGLWKSPTGYYIVIEVKTTDAYVIKTDTLLNYINNLVSDNVIPPKAPTLGLYVVGRPDAKLQQLENDIIHFGRQNQLRVISIDSLLSLVEMKSEYDVSHEDILAVIKPSAPTIDPVVELMRRLVVQEKAAGHPEISTTFERGTDQVPTEEVAYWMSPVVEMEGRTAEECIKELVGEEKVYAFGERTPGRQYIKPGDMMCFYAQLTGIVAHARVTSKPEERKHPKVRNPEKYKWVFKLSDVKLYLNKPVAIDSALRTNLDAFKDKDPNQAWSWFVFTTRKITKHDFELLTKSI
ncbi:EVE domain-containing protein [bacterium]|nr:EVE domain-containing protein [bacterium]